MANSAKTAKITKIKKSVKKMKNLFCENFSAPIFQPLMRKTAKQHVFLHIGAHLVAKGVLGQMGQIHPFSGKSANFSE